MKERLGSLNEVCQGVVGVKNHTKKWAKSPKIYGGIISMVFDHSGFISPDLVE